KEVGTLSNYFDIVNEFYTYPEGSREVFETPIKYFKIVQGWETLPEDVQMNVFKGNLPLYASRMHKGGRGGEIDKKIVREWDELPANWKNEFGSLLSYRLNAAVEFYALPEAAQEEFGTPLRLCELSRQFKNVLTRDEQAGFGS